MDVGATNDAQISRWYLFNTTRFRYGTCCPVGESERFVLTSSERGVDTHDQPRHLYWLRLAWCLEALLVVYGVCSLVDARGCAARRTSTQTCSPSHFPCPRHVAALNFVAPGTTLSIACPHDNLVDSLHSFFSFGLEVEVPVHMKPAKDALDGFASIQREICAGDTATLSMSLLRTS